MIIGCCITNQVVEQRPGNSEGLGPTDKQIEQIASEVLRAQRIAMRKEQSIATRVLGDQSRVTHMNPAKL